MDLRALLVILFVQLLQVAGSAIQARQIPGLLFNLRVSNISAHFTVSGLRHVPGVVVLNLLQGASLLNNQLR